MLGFVRAERGNIAIMTALLAVPLMLFVGLAIDSARGYAAQQRMAAALESAKQSACAVAETPMSGAKMAATAVITEFFKANHGNETITNTATEATVSGMVDTTFMRIAGTESVSIGASVTLAC